MVRKKFNVSLELGRYPMAPTLTPFTRDMWYGFEGADRLPSGRPPLYGERGVDATTLMVVIVCGNEEDREEGEGPVTVSVQLVDGRTGEDKGWWYATRFTEEGAEDLGTFLLRCFPSTYLDGERTVERDLEVLGFRRTL